MAKPKPRNPDKTPRRTCVRPASAMMELFAKLYTEPDSETFGNASRSAIVAGYSPNGASTTGSQLLRKASVQRLVSDFRAAQLARESALAELDATKVRAEFWRLQHVAEEDDDTTNALRALEGYARTLGLFKEGGGVDITVIQQFSEREAAEAKRISSLLLTGGVAGHALEGAVATSTPDELGRAPVSAMTEASMVDATPYDAGQGAAMILGQRDASAGSIGDDGHGAQLDQRSDAGSDTPSDQDTRPDCEPSQAQADSAPRPGGNQGESACESSGTPPNPPDGPGSIASSPQSNTIASGITCTTVDVSSLQPAFVIPIRVESRPVLGTKKCKCCGCDFGWVYMSECFCWDCKSILSGLRDKQSRDMRDYLHVNGLASSGSCGTIGLPSSEDTSHG